MIFAFEPFELDDELCELREAGTCVAIERRIFDLLVYLVRNRERLVSRAELLQVIWEGRAVCSGSVSVAVSAARRALRDRADAPRFIATQSRRGYRFIAPVVERSARPPTGPFSAHRNRSRSEDLIVGREEQCAEFETLLEAAGRGNFSVALVTGEAGIGKTRLLDEVARMAERKGFVAELGSCPDEPGAPPLWPWTQIIFGSALGGIARTLDSDVLPLNELRELLPLSDVKSDFFATPDPEASEHTRFRLTIGVAAVLEKIASRTPLLIMLDDIHRADQASLDLLASIGSTAMPRGVLLVAAYRDAPSLLRPVLRRALAVLLRAPCTHVFDLAGVSNDAARSLIGAILSSDASESLVREVIDRSGGNPFFIRQLIAHSQRRSRQLSKSDTLGLSHDLLAMIIHSLEDLPPITREILSIAALAGTEFSVDMLARISDLDISTVLRELQPAIDGRFLVQSDRIGALRFAHALVREALYQQLPSVRRAELHKRCGDILAERTSQQSPQHLSTLAHHYSQSVPLGTAREATHYSLKAAECAVAHASYEEAAGLYARVLELLPRTGDDSESRRCELLLLIGTQHLCGGARAEALAAFEAAARIAQSSGASDALATAALALAPGVLAIETGIVDVDLIKLLRAALASKSGDRSSLEAKLKARLSIALHWTADSRAVSSYANEALRIAATTGDPEALLYAKQAQWFSCHGPSASFSRLDLAEELVALAEACGDARLEMVCRLFVLGALLQAGESAAFDTRVAEYAALAERLRQPQLLWYVPMLRGASALLKGRLAEAAQWRDRFAAMGERAADANARHSAMAHTLLLLHEMDRAHEAISAVTQAVEEFPTVMGWRATRAWLHAHTGAVAEARRDIDLILDQGFTGGIERLDWMATAALLSEAVVLTRDSERAGILYDKLAPLDDRFFVVGLCVLSWGAVARNLGLLAAEMGDWPAARRHLEDAIRRNRAAGAVVWEAQSAIDLAQLLLRSPLDRDRGTARALAEAAAATATDHALPRLSRLSLDLLQST